MTSLALRVVSPSLVPACASLESSSIMTSEHKNAISTNKVLFSTGVFHSRQSPWQDVFGFPMNNRKHDDNDHVNGHRVNSDAVKEQEIDEYEDHLTNEAVLDQVKVSPYPCLCDERRFCRPKKFESLSTKCSKGNIHGNLG